MDFGNPNALSVRETLIFSKDWRGEEWTVPACPDTKNAEYTQLENDMGQPPRLAVANNILLTGADALLEPSTSGNRPRQVRQVHDPLYSACIQTCPGPLLDTLVVPWSMWRDKGDRRN